MDPLEVFLELEGDLQAVDRDGSGSPRVVASGVDVASRIEVTGGDRLFWISGRDDAVASTGPEVYAADGTLGNTVRVIDGQAYFMCSCRGIGEAFLRAPIDGSGSATELASGVGSPGSIGAFAIDAEHLSWRDGFEVKRVPTSGGSPETVTSPATTSPAIDDRFVYYITDDNAVMRVAR